MLAPNDTQIVVLIWVMFELFTGNSQGDGKKGLIRWRYIRATVVVSYIILESQLSRGNVQLFCDWVSR